MPSFHRDDEKFFKFLKQGHDWQIWLANRFRECGLECSVPELLIREDINLDQFKNRALAEWVAQHLAPDTVRGDFLNSQDMVIEPGLLDFILEAKSRSYKFTSPDDFYFDTIIIDTVAGYDAKDPKPHLYACISQRTKAVIFTSGRQSDRWSKETMFDNVRHTREHNYMCERKYWLSFETTIGTLRNLKKKYLEDKPLQVLS